MTPLRLYIINLVRVFKFIQNYRHRQAALRAEARAFEREKHDATLEVIKTLTTSVLDIIREQAAPTLALAEAVNAQTSLIAGWLKGFQVNDSTSKQVPSEKDEWIPAVPGGRAAFFPPDVDLPEEFKLAFMLQHEGETFDREGRDEI